jgi:hypothetical protein
VSDSGLLTNPRPSEDSIDMITPRALNKTEAEMAVGVVNRGSRSFGCHVTNMPLGLPTTSPVPVLFCDPADLRFSESGISIPRTDSKLALLVLPILCLEFSKIISLRPGPLIWRRHLRSIIRTIAILPTRSYSALLVLCNNSTALITQR